MGHGDAPPPPQGYPPYPPQQQQGVTAPGGYPVQSPGAAGAGSSTGQPYPPAQGAAPYPPPQGAAPYPPQPHPSAMNPPSKPTPAGPYPGAAPPSGYPGAPPPMGAPGPYPPAGAYAGAPGYPPGPPVMGTPAAAGAPIGGMSVEQGGAPPGREPCSCTVGWVLFAIGFLFWPCWVAAAFVPLCTKSRSDRLAGIASTVAMLILTIIAIIIGVTSPRWRYY